MVGNKQTDYDEIDLGALEAIANHIAPVLHARLQRDKHENNLVRAEQLLRQRTRYLSERVKELNCLYGISDLVVKPGISLKDSIWKQTCDINNQGKTIGTLKVCYIEQRSERQEGPFLAEERLLINAIAE